VRCKCDHAGLEAARKAVFTGIPWQRCQFHLQQNAQQYIPRMGMRREAAEDTPALAAGASVRTIFNAPDKETADTYLKKAVEKYAIIAPKLADWMEINIPEGFTVFSFPREHQRRLRTSNFLERLSQEIKRRTRVVRVFPNEQSCVRLISAILMEVSEEWEYGRLYLEMEPD
jgi:transposase-like protein